MAPSASLKKKPIDPRQTTGLLDYLKTVLTRKELQELYLEPARGSFVCRAVLQQLSSTAQQIVMRMHCTGGTFPVKAIEAWAVSPVVPALQEMQSWALIKKPDEMVSLTESFAKGLTESLCCLEDSPWTSLTPEQLESLAADSPKKERPPVTLEQLEAHTQQQWDAVLHYLVGSTGKQDPPKGIVDFLLETKLMQLDPDFKGRNMDDAPPVITESGYDFMLQDSTQQVWHFVVQYLQTAAKRGAEKGEDIRKEALLLLITLSFAKVAEPYLSSLVSKRARTMIRDFAHFGLLYTTIYGKTTVFYPTRIATQLGASSHAGSIFSMSTKAMDAALSAPNPRGSSHLAIIVQTNFQLCAYTTSELHVNMLGLFCDIGTIRRLPNVVFMHITRDSVKSAFALGIQARQILRFLEKHTHPRLRDATQEKSCIPDNVIDQIWLWDQEMGRVRFTQVYQHDCMMGTEEFEAVVAQAKKNGAHRWSSKTNQRIILDFEYVDVMESFVLKWRAETYNN